MCDERTDHTGLCRPLLSNLHSFTPYCDIGPASEDISCSVRPLRCFRFVPLPCSCFPFEIMLTETLLQGTFGTGQGWPRHLVDQPGSSPNAFLRSSNFLDSVQVWTRRTAHLRSSATLSFCCKSWVTTHNSVKSVGGGFRPCFLVHAGRRSGSVLSNLISWKFRPTTGCWSCRSPAHERTRQICT